MLNGRIERRKKIVERKAGKLRENESNAVIEGQWNRTIKFTDARNVRLTLVPIGVENSKYLILIKILEKRRWLWKCI